MPPEQSTETRLALLEQSQINSAEQHREVIGKLNEIARKMDGQQCTLHAARQLQLQQDLDKIKDVDLVNINRKLEDNMVKLASLSGAIGGLTFLAGKLFQ